VGADGTLRCGKAAGSIHQVGAAVQEVPSCNGWLFWHMENKAGGLRVLDELRAEIAGG
jgi:modification methylase